MKLKSLFFVFSLMILSIPTTSYSFKIKSHKLTAPTRNEPVFEQPEQQQVTYCAAYFTLAAIWIAVFAFGPWSTQWLINQK